MRVDIKYHADIDRIQQTEVGDWIDLRAAADTFCPVNEEKKISLGVSMQLPEGYEAILAPRSSTFGKYGLLMTNGIGIIDNAYCGDDDIWQFPAWCLNPKDFVEKGDGTMIYGTMVKKNERICQFRIQKKMEKIEANEVDHLKGKNRGGFGSTGVR